MSATLQDARIERVVCETVASVGCEIGFSLSDVGPDTSLVDDMGLDSLKFVDLTVALEQSLGIRVFPMQDWVDAEQRRQAPVRFTVRSLSEACRRALADQAR